MVPGAVCRRGGGEVGGELSRPPWASQLLHRVAWLSTSVSAEKISFDRDFKGVSNLDKSTRALLCVAQSHSLLGSSLGKTGGDSEEGDFEQQPFDLGGQSSDPPGG